MRIWLSRGFRLACVVGLLSAGYNVINNLKLYSEAEQRNSETRSIYECVERIPDELAKVHMNEYGNINAKALGCSIRESWAGSREIADMRLGKLDFNISLKKFNLVETLYFAISSFLLVMSMVLISIASIFLSR